MLFYNHKQEFIGIDDDGLKLLNYDSLPALLEVCGDVADLFAKEPGYIHNFKNFGWIDFLLHADSDASSAIVHANGRTFSCVLQVHKLYLCTEPAQNGYMIDMLHVVPISGEEIKPRPVPAKPPLESKPAEEATPPEETVSSVLPDYGHLTPTPLSEPGTLDIPSYEEVEFETFPEPAEDLYETPSFPEPAEEFPLTPSAQPEEPRPASAGIRYSPEEQHFIDELKVDRSYRFDPSVAANELGLPVDLIQEFIGDFIQQSHDFKKDLYDAAMKGDMNNLKILSHKLKGVAANLRIEDAFECLSIINTSEDIVQIEANLKYFYGIVNKLEGKEEADSDYADYDDTRFIASEEPSAATFDIADEMPFKEDFEPAYRNEPASPAGVDDDIYAFALKPETDEPLASMETETPDYSVALKQDESEPLMVQQGELDMMEEIPPSAPAEVQSVQLNYDKTAIAGQLGIEAAFFDELIDDYKRDAQIAGQQIADAISAFDTHLWKKTASQLKGISDNLRLSEISEELAVLSRTNDAQEAHKASKRLTGYLEQL